MLFQGKVISIHIIFKSLTYQDVFMFSLLPRLNVVKKKNCLWKHLLYQELNISGDIPMLSESMWPKLKHPSKRRLEGSTHWASSS